MRKTKGHSKKITKTVKLILIGGLFCIPGIFPKQHIVEYKSRIVIDTKRVKYIPKTPK